ncbi:MAG: hypothetical protein AB1445_04375 [Bacillota bacterium]
MILERAFSLLAAPGVLLKALPFLMAGGMDRGSGPVEVVLTVDPDRAPRVHVSVASGAWITARPWGARRR